MPSGRSHQISDRGALPASGSLSDMQLAQISNMLDEQCKGFSALLVLRIDNAVERILDEIKQNKKDSDAAPATTVEQTNTDE